MPTSDNAALVRRIYDAYNDRNFDMAAENVTDDYEFRMVPTGQQFHSTDGVRQYLQGWADGFPESRVEITNIVADERGAVIEFTGRGVHSGTLKTPQGEIAATGKQAELQFCDIYEVRDGKLASGRTYFDMASLMRQLGLMS